MTVTIDEKANTMTIVLPLRKPEPSKTGKTLIVATTSGIAKTGVKVAGKEVSLGVNAFIPR